MRSDVLGVGAILAGMGLYALSVQNEKNLKARNERLKGAVLLWRSLCLITWAVAGGVLVI